MFYFFHVQQSTFIQIPCHLLLVAAQWWRAGFHLTGAHFWSRAYITSILQNHTRAYFQGNKVVFKGLSSNNTANPSRFFFRYKVFSSSLLFISGDTLRFCSLPKVTQAGCSSWEYSWESNSGLLILQPVPSSLQYPAN